MYNELFNKYCEDNDPFDNIDDEIEEINQMIIKKPKLA
jgi:hypothetical protein